MQNKLYQTQPKKFLGVQNMQHPELVQFEETHSVHFYGSKVTHTRAGWRCYNEDKSGYVKAPTLDLLVARAPHCVKHVKPKRIPRALRVEPPYVYRAAKPHPSRRNKKLAHYEKTHNVVISGYNVTYRVDHWTCLNPTKTSSRSFETLEDLVATCPYVISA